MKKFMYLILMSMLISCTNEPGTDGGNGGDGEPVRKPITHNGTLEGSEFTLHGQVEGIKLFGKYGRLSEKMIETPQSVTDGGKDDIATFKRNGLHIDNAGFYIAFDTDATTIDIEATLRKQSQYPQYASAEQFQLLQWDRTEYKSVKVSAWNNNTKVASFDYTPTTTGEQKYILLFPTYNGIAENKDLKITVNKEAKVYNSFPFNEDKQLPILVYGTSVTQGAWGSTVRSNYTSILSFESKREVLNLGFSGAAYLGKDMADYLAKIPSHIFFIDPTLNLDGNETVHKTRAEYLIKKYREYNKITPIVVVSRFHIGNTGSDEGIEGQWMKDVVTKLAPTVKNLHFLSRSELGEYTSTDLAPDGQNAHPNSSGMEKWASAYLKMMKKLNR